VYSAVAGYSDAGTFSVYAGCAPDRVDEVVTVIRGILDDVAAHGLTPAEVARAQGNLRGGLVLGLEDTSSRMNRLGRAEIDHGRQRSIGESLGRIAAVTEQEVRELARELLSGPLTVAVVGPYDSPADLPDSLRQ
jgi:predicted Zn-dependent peptidase